MFVIACETVATYSSIRGFGYRFCWVPYVTGSLPWAKVQVSDYPDFSRPIQERGRIS